MSKRSTRIYKISFYNQGNVYELYAKQINQSTLFGFIELSELIFGATSNVVVDPVEERLKNEFGGVKVTYIPMHAVLRIDEVEKEGIAKIQEVSSKSGNNVTQFPVPIYTPTHPSNNT